MLRSLCLILLGGFVLIGCAQPRANPQSAAPKPAFTPGELNPDAPPETIQFGQLVGQWNIRDETKQPDGTWQPGPGAVWNWYYVLNGYAVQDDWIAPIPNAADGTPSVQYGTNLRIYNPQANQWEMAWTSNTGPNVTTFTATQESESLVMRGIYAAGRPNRITFFDITETTFEWKLEIQQPDESWNEVYRIHATRL